MALSRPLSAALTAVALAADGTGQGFSRSYRRRFSRESGPSLYADFTSGQLPGGWLFTRSSSATRVNTAGVVETVPANVPRFDHDPVTLAPLGLLVEQQSTNLFTFSGDLANAAWNKRAGMGLAANAGAAPDGSGGAYRAAKGSSADGYLWQFCSLSASTTYTVSFHAKALSAGQQFKINAFDGTAASVSGTFTATTGWQRYSFSFTTSASVGASDVGIQCLGDLLLWGGQLEQVAFASSYIPTAASAGTRAVDTCTLGLGPWWNTAKGTLLVEASLAEAIAGGPVWPHLFNVDDGSSANQIQGFLQVNVGTLDYDMITRSNGVSQANMGVGLGLPSAIGHRMAFGWRYGTGTYRGSVDGGAVVTSAEGLPPVGLTTLRLGGVFQSYTRRIRRLAYYGDLLGDAQLRSVTA